MKNIIKNSLVAGLVVIGAVTSITIGALNADDSRSINTGFLEIYFNTTNITRTTINNRNGIYTLTTSGRMSNLPRDFELVSSRMNFTRDGIYTTKELAYTPLRFSVNTSTDRYTEAIRIRTLYNRSEITRSQYMYLIAELEIAHNRPLPPSIAASRQEQIQERIEEAHENGYKEEVSYETYEKETYEKEYYEEEKYEEEYEEEYEEYWYW